MSIIFSHFADFCTRKHTEKKSSKQSSQSRLTDSDKASGRNHLIKGKSFTSPISTYKKCIQDTPSGKLALLVYTCPYSRLPRLMESINNKYVLYCRLKTLCIDTVINIFLFCLSTKM